MFYYLHMITYVKCCFYALHYLFTTCYLFECIHVCVCVVYYIWRMSRQSLLNATPDAHILPTWTNCVSVRNNIPVLIRWMRREKKQSTSKVVRTHIYALFTSQVGVCCIDLTMSKQTCKCQYSVRIISLNIIKVDTHTHT